MIPAANTIVDLMHLTRSLPVPSRPGAMVVHLKHTAPQARSRPFLFNSFKLFDRSPGSHLEELPQIHRDLSA